MRPAKLGAPLVLAVVLAAPPPDAFAAGRVALVVGNGTYAHIGPLPNPGNDAADMTAALRRLGFEVTTVRDADCGFRTKSITDSGANRSLTPIQIDH